MEAANKLNIAVVGAGAMGSLFGAYLSTSAHVVLVDTWSAHVEAINRQGLTVELPDGDSTVFPLNAMSGADQLKAPVDVAIIFTKSADTMAATQTAQKLLKYNGIVLTLQNGIGNLEVIQQVIDKGRALAGVTTHGATILAPGKVRHSGSGSTHIARPAQDLPDFDALIQTFAQAGFEITLSDDISSLIWGKLIINVGINALAAILRVPNGVLAEVEPAQHIMSATVLEAVLVAKALGIDLPDQHPVDSVLYACRNTATNRASMLQDMLRGANTEIDVINGAIVRIGEALGIPTPCNRLLADMVKALENTRSERIQAEGQ
jgi:2-dehydropantoate 2-reductase